MTWSSYESFWELEKNSVTTQLDISLHLNIVVKKVTPALDNPATEIQFHVLIFCAYFSSSVTGDDNGTYLVRLLRMLKRWSPQWEMHGVNAECLSISTESLYLIIFFLNEKEVNMFHNFLEWLTIQICPGLGFFKDLRCTEDCSWQTGMVSVHSLH